MGAILLWSLPSVFAYLLICRGLGNKAAKKHYKEFAVLNFPVLQREGGNQQ
jgi:hypothetical protein